MADTRAERIADLIKPLRVKPGSKVNLAKDFDPGYKAGVVKKKDGKKAKAEARERAKAEARGSRVAGNGHQLGQAGQSASRWPGAARCVISGHIDPELHS